MKPDDNQNQPEPQQPQPQPPAQNIQSNIEVPRPPVATSNNSNKKPIVGLVAGVGGLVVIGIVVAVLLSVMGVSKTDYNEASSQASDVISSYNEAGSTYLSASSTTTELKNGLDKIKSSVDEFETGLTELGDMKAVKKDKEVKESYEQVMDKKSKFDKAIGAAMEAYESVLPELTNYSASSTSTSSINNAINNIASVKNSLRAIEGLTHETNKQLVSELTSQFTKLETLAIKVKAGRDDYKKYDSAAVSEYYKVTTDVSRSLRDWQSNLDRLGDEGEMKNELNDLASLLSKKTY